MYINLDIWARISLFTDIDIIPGYIKAVDGAVINLLHRYLFHSNYLFCLISIFASFKVGVTGRPTIVGPDAYSRTA